MGDEKLTATALRERQEVAERDAAAMRREIEERQRGARAELDESNARVLVEGWHHAAADAAKREGVRFVVLASVAGERARGLLAPLVEDATALGYTAAFVREPTPVARRRGGTAQPHEESLVMSDGVKGWRPAGLPSFGTGETRWLIVGWQASGGSSP